MKRLLPRFSLRFALLALTVFLIVFGVVGSYCRELQRHDQAVKKFISYNYGVEVDERSLLGIVYEKRIIGLVASARDPEYVDVFQELPHPEHLQGLSINHARFSAAQDEQFFQKLKECAALERLELSLFPLNSSHLETLGSLKNLRHLNLSMMRIPAGSATFLQELPELETLELDLDKLTIDQITRLNLPQLRVLRLKDCPDKELHLTRDGLGHFPKLAILEVEGWFFKKILCEPDALPKLRQLAIPRLDGPLEVDWQQLSLAAPQLYGLSLSARQINSQSLKVISLPQIQYLHVAGLRFSPKKWVSHPTLDWEYAVEYERGVFAMLASKPHLKFYSDFKQYLSAIMPPGILLEYVVKERGHWPSKKWISKSTFMPVTTTF